MMSRALARIHRLLLWLLPGEFRGDYGDAMTADVATGARDSAFWIRELRGLLWAIVREHADVFRQDVRYALRLMRRTPWFTAIAVAMLALGTGASVTMFSVVDAVLLRSRFERPDRLVFVMIQRGQDLTLRVPRERYAELVAAPGPLRAIAQFTQGSHVMTGIGDPRNLDNIECVSASMFPVLGTRPFLGRTLDATDDRPGADAAIVLSFTFWNQLGGSPDLVGRQITLNQNPVTVVGVMPKGFAGPIHRSNVQGWVPMARPISGPDSAGCRTTGTVIVTARLRDGVSAEAAAAELAGRSFGLSPLEAPVIGDVRPSLTALTAAVSCVLLIACLNVGGLQMERMLARRREIALRMALGAGRGRLARQTLTENLIIAMAGTIAGVALTSLTLRALVSIMPTAVPHLPDIEVNTRVLAAALALSTTSALIAELIPMAQSRRCDPAQDLVGTGRATERHAGWMRRALVVVELALSILVLIGAGLMLRTFLALMPSQPGFDPANKLVVTVRLRGTTPDESALFFGTLFDRLLTIPAVKDVAGTTYWPMSVNSRAASFGDKASWNLTNYVTPRYFSLMKIPVITGRDFTAADAKGSLPVIIVNDMFARRLRPDGQVIGERVSLRPDDAEPTDPPEERTIVGVIANTRNNGADTRPRSETYIPNAQRPSPALDVIAQMQPGHEAEAAAAIRTALRTLRPDLVVEPPQLLTQLLDRRVAAPRFGATVLGVFAGIAVALAAIGLMTTIGWWVTRRTREIGVRVALGADRNQIVRLILRQGLTLAGVGVALGLVAAAFGTRVIATMLYGVTPLDASTFVGCGVFMLAVAALASYLPARRAAKVDPLISLRSE